MLSDKILYLQLENRRATLFGISKKLQINLTLLLSDSDSFTMVEENIENWHSEKLQIGLIFLLSDNHSLAMVEEIFEY